MPTVEEGIVFRGNKCWHIARLFDICTPRREKIAQEVAKLYRNGKYLGDCVIIYEVTLALCALLKSK